MKREDALKLIFDSLWQWNHHVQPTWDLKEQACLLLEILEKAGFQPPNVPSFKYDLLNETIVYTHEHKFEEDI